MFQNKATKQEMQLLKQKARDYIIFCKTSGQQISPFNSIKWFNEGCGLDYHQSPFNQAYLNEWLKAVDITIKKLNK